MEQRNLLSSHALHFTFNLVEVFHCKFSIQRNILFSILFFLHCFPALALSACNALRRKHLMINSRIIATERVSLKLFAFIELFHTASKQRYYPIRKSLLKTQL